MLRPRIWLWVLVVLIHHSFCHVNNNQRLLNVVPVTTPTIQLVHATTRSYAKRSTLSHFNDLQHDDSFLLEFDAYNQGFALYLKPNLDLLHPRATETIFDDETGTSESFPLVPQDHRIYKGQVLTSVDHFLLANDLISEKDMDQWARITMRHDIEHNHPFPLFEGSFSYDGDLYHIKSSTNYHLSKRHDDPLLHHDPPLLIYRDSDLFDDTILDNLGTYPSSLLSPRSLSPLSPSTNGSNSTSQPSNNTASPALNNTSHIMCAMEELKYNQKLTGFTPPPHHAKPPPPASTADPLAVLWNKRSLQRRDASTVQGCPSTRKIAFMGAAADCTYTTTYGSIRLARSQMLTDWNVASAVYERTFNISLGLIYMQMSKPNCIASPSSSSSSSSSSPTNTAWNQPCSSAYSIGNRLSDFSFWRGQRGDDDAALWHLMTQCSTGVKVGIAWLSQLCEYQASQQIEDNGSYDWVSGTGVSSIVRDEWKVVAHEIGHGFGAIHDCTPQSCSCAGGCGCCPLSSSVCSAGDTYLMNPTSNVTTNDFSPCSITDVCNSFPSIGYCLKSPGDINNSTFHICGNGILEPGEQCDPGPTDSPCCYAKNCTLKTGAVCDDYSSLCCVNCGIAAQGTVCRPAASECDTDEVCNGMSSQCPSDVYDPDGTPCSNGTMQCASGICTSRDDQCIARGMRLNITHQCPFQEDSCQITCADPSDSQNCLVLSGIFLDGTECGLAGFCRGGSCVSSGLDATIRAWVNKNLNIAIPVFVFGGLFILAVLALLVWFIRRRYFHRRLFKEKNSRPSSITSSRHGEEGGGDNDLGFGGNNGNQPPSSLNNSNVHRLPENYLAGFLDAQRRSQYSTSQGSHHTAPSMTPPGTVDSGTPSEAWELRTFSSHEDEPVDPKTFSTTTPTADAFQLSRRYIHSTSPNIVIATGTERRPSTNA
ncbi:hypothetical protein DM01DRAFT_1309533 [Hesseltinella vesiculosa]|uniref:Disintegrin and metalloproteinase domain-containing protein B n=1 Tax=Hesseltinella vesiculosa TaxID=101127 RepID=A0A1X2G9E5_9FUNG|nr:hypothetical protein DM01DRAFT_1309533 [Hesseltinella vesiculosa]